MSTVMQIVCGSQVRLELYSTIEVNSKKLVVKDK